MGSETMPRETVMIVDDEPQVLAALSDLFESDYGVLAHSSAAEALETLASGRKVSCILSDLRMPGRGGDSFLAEARRLCPAPRILLMADADLGGVIRSINDGKIFGCFAKPWDAAALQLMLKQAVEHHRMSEALAQERALLKNLMESLPDAVYFKDQNHRYVRISPVKAAALGIDDAEDAIGKTNTAFLSANRAWEIEREEEWIFRTGKAVADKVEPVRSPEGGMCWLSTTKAPVRNEEGEVVGLVCVARDVTSRMLGQQRLAESERRFRAFYNHTPAMLQTVDARGRLVYVSDFWCEALGYSRTDVIGRYMVEFMAAAERKTLEARLFQQLARDGEIKNWDCRLIAKDGHVLDAVLSAIVERDDRGELVRALCVLTDVTQKKALEQQLLQSQKLEAIGQLTGGIAHDFNDLLAVIAGNLDVAAGQAEGPLRELIIGALEASEKGADLTHRLLAYARRQLLTPCTFDPGELVMSVKHLLVRTLGERISIELSQGPGLWPVHADKEQLETALVNLAINARDAMPDGGTIGIRLENVAAQGPDLRDCVQIAVTDSGIGMTAEAKAHAAEPFFTTKEGGSGLGLSSIDGFMRQSGGLMQIESQRGRGTEVRLHFPRAPGRAEPLRDGPSE
jgi:PAS domain S-box-containing protein